MPGKFINEITGDTPAKDDLAVFFDKSKNSTAQATIAEMVNAGLDLAAGAKGQVPTIDVKVDAATSSLVNILTWGAGGGVDFKGTPTRPPTGTDEILTNDPANGLIGKTTLQQLVVAGGATILQPGTAVNTALVWNDTAGKWEPARAVGEAKNINGGKIGELPFQLNEHVTAWIPLGSAGQVLTITDVGNPGNPFIAPSWMDPVNELPTFTIADKGKQLTVKADGKATEWVEDAKELPTITSGLTALQTKADKSGVEWVTSVNQATNLKGGFTSGAFFPVNDTKTDTTRFVDAAAFRKLSGVPEQSYFPNWTPVNEQLGAGWNDMGVALARMASIIRADALAPAAGTVTFTPANSFPGSSGFVGCTITPGMKVVCVPTNYTASLIYDFNTSAVSQSAFTSYPAAPGTGGRYKGSVLLNNGKVFFVPSGLAKGAVYDPVSDSAKLTTGDSTTGFAGGVLLRNGKVFCVPYTANKAQVYDPATELFTDVTGVFPGGEAFIGGVLLPSGKVFCVPLSSKTAAIYDPDTNTATFTPALFPGGSAFAGGVLMYNGKVFCVPCNSKFAGIYDPETGLYSQTSAIFPGAGAFITGVALASGKVFCTPYNSTVAKLYDPVTDTAVDVPGFPGNGAYHHSKLLPNGDVFCCPYNATRAAIVRFASSQVPTVSSNVYLSPFFNKL